MPIQKLTGMKTFFYMVIIRIMTEREKNIVQSRSQLPLIEAD